MHFFKRTDTQARISCSGIIENFYKFSSLYTYQLNLIVFQEIMAFFYLVTNNPSQDQEYDSHVQYLQFFLIVRNYL